MAEYLYGLDLDELKAAFKKINEPAFRAQQMADWIYKKHIIDIKEAKNFSTELIKKISETFSLFALQHAQTNESSNHESKKFLFKTLEGQFIESVLIAQQDRRTVCVSTQVGCKIGCSFCASGKGKFGRNLTPAEIVEQVAYIERLIGEKVTNIVYMGMGEPLDNFEATMKSLQILQADWGFELGARRITVSTSGITPKILEFVSRSEGRVRLSVSLHSSDEMRRSELVPINKKYSLAELKKTLFQIHKKLKRDITFEYTVIAGVNDSLEEAEGVARMAIPLQAKVNLIPFNPIKEAHYKSPTEEQVEKFKRALERRGVRVIVRQTAGRDIDAACGQLARRAS